jgi:WD40 repeat protein
MASNPDLDELEKVKRRAAQRRRRTIYLVGALLIVVAAAGVAALFSIEARRQSRFSLSRQLAAQSTALMDSQPDLAQLLSIESRFVNNTVDGQSGLATFLRGHTADVNSVAFSPDGKTLVSGSNDGTIILWDVSNPKAPVELGQPLKGHTSHVESVAFSPDGKTLASVGFFASTIILWDVSNRQSPVELDVPLGGHSIRSYVYSAAFFSDGKTLASGGDDGIVLWDVSNPKAPVQLGEPVGDPAHGIFISNGKTLASGSGDNIIILWDMSNPGAPIKLGWPLTGHTNFVRSMAFSPDGKTLASGSCGKIDASLVVQPCLQGEIILWDVSNPKSPIQFRARLADHTDWVYSLAFSPDGRALASGSFDGSIILWDVSNPKSPVQLGATLSGHSYVVNSLAFSPDGKTLASGSWDDTIILWAVDPILWQASACQSVSRNFTRAEWVQYLGNEPYRQTCPQWPTGK